MDSEPEVAAADQEQLEQRELQFVKPLNNITKYKKDQKELVLKALDITGGNPLDALKYIVSCMAHEGHEIELKLVVSVTHKETYMYMPIVTQMPKNKLEDKLGYYVSWGDGTITHNTKKHTYKVPNDYEIRIFGLNITGFGEDDISNYNMYLTKVISFGNLGHKFTSLDHAFYICEKLQSIPANIPRSVTNLANIFSNNFRFNLSVETWDVSNVKNMAYMFQLCTEFNQSLEKWNTSNVTDMHGMFSMCDKFNQSINSWDTSNVTDMSYMFNSCVEYDQPLDSWNVEKVVNMNGMFNSCLKFNQPLNTWTTCNVTNMSNMFNNCYKFDKPLASWDTSNVTDMGSMFERCYVFNQPLATWNVKKVRDIRNMFEHCFVFNQSLITWEFSKGTKADNLFNVCGIHKENKPRILT
jgi:surface protein